MKVSNGINLYTRERVLSVSNEDNGNPAFWEEFHITKVWKRFADIYGCTDANLNRIVAALHLMYPNRDYFRVEEVSDVFVTMIDSGGSVNDPLDRLPLEVEEPTPASTPVPVDRNGRKLSASQIAWGQMARWSETATSAQVTERRRTDPAYASFYHTNLVRSLDSVGDSALETNPHLVAQDAPTIAALKNSRLVEFSRRYKNMSSAEVRSARSKAANPLTADQFVKDVNDAIKLNLL